MKIYIDCREIECTKYTTSLQVFYNDEIVKEGLLKRGDFSIVDLGTSYFDHLNFRLKVIEKDAQEDLMFFPTCSYSEVECLRNNNDYEETYKKGRIGKYECGREENNLPKSWIYAYDTLIKGIASSISILVLVFSKDYIEDMGFCEVINEPVEASFVRNLNIKQLIYEFKRWLIRWGIKSIITLSVSIALFFLIAVMINAIIDYLFVKTEGILWGINTLFVLILPNVASIYDLVEKIKLLRRLKRTEKIKGKMTC